MDCRKQSIGPLYWRGRWSGWDCSRTLTVSKGYSMYLPTMPATLERRLEDGEVRWGVGMAYGTVDDVFDGLHHCCPGFQVHWRSGRPSEGLEVTCAFLICCWFHVDDVSRSERGEVTSSFLPDRQTNCQDRDQNSSLSAFKWCVNKTSGCGVM